jgi:hypothetical protein
MAVALTLAIAGMAIDYGGQYIEGQLWMLILAAQAIPYVSALIGASVANRSREEPQEAAQADSLPPFADTPHGASGSAPAVN